MNLPILALSVGMLVFSARRWRKGRAWRDIALLIGWSLLALEIITGWQPLFVPVALAMGSALALTIWRSLRPEAQVHELRRVMGMTVEEMDQIDREHAENEHRRHAEKKAELPREATRADFLNEFTISPAPTPTPTTPNPQLPELAELIRSGYPLGPAQLEAIRTSPATIKELETLAHSDDPATASESAAAAETLHRIENSTGRTALRRMLASDLPAFQIEALERLSYLAFDDKTFQLEEAASLIASPDPKVRQMAAFQAVESPTHYEETLDRLIAGEFSRPGILTKRLTDVLPPELLKSRLLPFALSQASREPDREWASALVSLRHHPSLSDTDRANVDAALTTFCQTCDQAVQFQQNVVYDLTKPPTPTLRDYYESAITSAKDSVSIGYALRALAKIDPPRAVDFFDLASETPHLIADCVHSLPDVLTDTNREQVISEVLRLNQHYLLQPRLIPIIYRTTGPAGRQFLDLHRNELTAASLLRLTWLEHDFDLNQFIAALNSSDLIRTPLDPQKTLTELRSEIVIPDDDPAGVPHILEAAGLAFAFDAEADVVPPDYDNLFHSIAKWLSAVVELGPLALAPGQLDPELLESWEESDQTHFYDLRIRAGISDIQLRAPETGDWYCVSTVERILVTALHSNNCPQRLFSYDHEIPTLLVAEPDPWNRVAETFYLPTKLISA